MKGFDFLEDNITSTTSKGSRGEAVNDPETFASSRQ